jgi:hypothetical protein
MEAEIENAGSVALLRIVGIVEKTHRRGDDIISGARAAKPTLWARL